MKDKIFKVNAVLGEKGYKHFGIHPCTCSLYGSKEEDIIELGVEIAEDQSLPDKDTGTEEADYWAWLPEGKDGFSLMVYPQYFLLNMCFPYGIKSSEEAGHGKAYRINIIKEL